MSSYKINFDEKCERTKEIPHDVECCENCGKAFKSCNPIEDYCQGFINKHKGKNK